MTIAAFAQSAETVLPTVTIVLAALVLLALAVGAFFFWFTKPRIDDNVYPAQKSGNVKKLNDLFLRVSFSPRGDSKKPHSGYLRSLTLNRATLVAGSNTFKKGETLDLVLDSGVEAHIPCRIVGAKPLGDSYLIEVRFINPDIITTNVVRSYMRKTLDPMPQKNVYTDKVETRLH
jgi:hypothetical protein